MAAEALVEVTRGGLRESVHAGHAVVCAADGAVIEGWGDPDEIAYPRSTAKMMQALPLLETGAADAFGLGPEHIALACASHVGAAVHTSLVRRWLAAIGMDEGRLRCGCAMPEDMDAARLLMLSGQAPGQAHHACSGEHSGFLTVLAHLGQDAEYTELDHPLQRAILLGWEEEAGEATRGAGIDGCSIPTHATRLAAMARAHARFAGAAERSGARARAQVRIVEAMMAHPEMIWGAGRACTELTRALDGRGAVKRGAEGNYAAILPGLGLGIAVKIADGSLRAGEAAIAGLLVRLGALEAGHPVARRYADGPLTNARGLEVGRIRALV